MEYRILNLVKKKWWDGKAVSVRAACKKAGWERKDCWIRVKSQGKYAHGWSNVKEKV